MTLTRSRLRRAVVASAIALLVLLAGVSAAKAATPDISIPSWVQTYFSPNGDGQEDAATVYYCLAESANVTVTVVDSSDNVVRTLEDGASRSGSGGGCYYGYNNSVSWDGMSDAGSVVPDGVYTLKLHAVDASGQTADASVQLGVDTRAPGVLTMPSPGDTLSGSADWSFMPASGFPVSAFGVIASRWGVFVGVEPGGGWDLQRFDGHDRVRERVNGVVAVASWIDRFGVAHSWSAPAVSVTINNGAAASAAVDPGGDADVFQPERGWAGGHGHGRFLPVKNANVDCERKVDRRVERGRDGADDRVAADTRAASGGCPYWGDDNSESWDGMSDAGSVVPDGVYTHQVARG